MNKDTKFSVHAHIKSFQFAFQGLVYFFKVEYNAWIHLVATIVVIGLSIFLGISPAEAIALTIAIALVWITEMLNTCLEKAMDLISKEYDIRIKVIKDISAGSVIVAALAALVIGLVVFLPKFF